MSKIPISLGMYTVYDDVKKDIIDAFKKLFILGYDGIEFYGEPAEYDILDVKKAIDSSGLNLTSWHIEWRNLQNETINQTIKYLKDVGCNRAIVPCLGGEWNVAHTPKEECLSIWETYIKKMNEIVIRLIDEGISMGYHNHEHEFLLNYNNKSVFDILFQNLDSNIIMEFDTGNAIEGGVDPKTVIDKYQGRQMLIHCKPFSKTAEFDTFIGADDDLNNWSEIVSACKTKCLGFIVESESKVKSGMENAKLCIEGLKNYL